MWFDSWSQVLRVVLVGAAAYGGLVLLLRVSGKRTLAKLNAYDLVVTVALGSILATVLLNTAVSWSEGLTAMAVLVVLQLVVAAIAAWVPGGHALATARPTVLLRDGQVDESALRRSRVARQEVSQAVRSSGQGDLSAVAAVVLETDGTLSVVPASAIGDGSALPDAPAGG
ncbi:DUF421 domain-containing protein [Nocardioides sp. CPCC 205120]|uniref:DUF421 domain-containing protein n=1 Tax=Nocardioides sp. CPCC 205120 TaxID=3406462 RepID=UPI003B50F773